MDCPYCDYEDVFYVKEGGERTREFGAHGFFYMQNNISRTMERRTRHGDTVRTRLVGCPKCKKVFIE